MSECEQCEQCEHIVVDFHILFRTMSRISDLPPFEKCLVWFDLSFNVQFHNIYFANIEILTNFRLHQYSISTLCAIRNEMREKISASVSIYACYNEKQWQKAKQTFELTFLNVIIFSEAFNI